MLKPPKQVITPPPTRFKFRLFLVALAILVIGLIILFLGKVILGAIIALLGAVFGVGSQVAGNKDLQL